ncbi:MAG: hypothetical protein EOP05_01020 [Proteobacteria bacterium]|nr:MAG: hypothetical protein EOP05_01020 [Pseudomonadota bacterium]
MDADKPFSIIVALFIWSVLTAVSPEAQASRLNVLTLNLHGYHPMGKEERQFESRDGKTRRAESFLTYFPFGEIQDGHEKQLEFLSREFAAMNEPDLPHVIFLQEVGAGLPSSAKDCQEFYANPGTDFFGKNSALRLASRLETKGVKFHVELACRGNIGWRTDANTFSTERILSASGQVVFDFGANPYPNGFIVEGTAILVREPYRILDQRVEWLQIPETSDKAFIQFARVQKSGEKGWTLIANLHGTHKVRHFESAVTFREALENFVASHSDRANYLGAIVSGDFNANLYRPNSKLAEVSTAPWEIGVSGEFDFAHALDNDFIHLEETLWKQNVDPKFKPWANIGTDSAARKRVSIAVERFKRLARSNRLIDLQEAFIGFNPKKCLNFMRLDSACEREDRIDLVFASHTLSPLKAAILFSKNSFYSLVGPTDHPGVYAQYEY